MKKQEIIEKLEKMDFPYKEPREWKRHSLLHNLLITRVKNFRKSWSKKDLEEYYERALKCQFIYDNYEHKLVQEFLDDRMPYNWCYDKHILELYYKLKELL